MNNTRKLSFTILLVSVFLIAACSSAVEPAAEVQAEEAIVETAAEGSDSAMDVTYVEGIPQYGCLGSAEDALVDLECREVTFAVENAYLPFNYISIETNQAGGWDYEIFPMICEMLHCTPIFVETVWETMVQQVQEGQFDMAGDGITIKPEREENGDFSIGYVQTVMRLLVNKGEDRFTSIEEFVANPDLIMGTQINTTNYDTAIEFLPEERVQAFETFPFANQALLSGDVDAVIMDEMVGLGYQGENAELLELIGPAITSDELGFYFPEGSDLVDPVNQALQVLIADGRLNALNAKYFGPSFDLTYDDVQ